MVGSWEQRKGKEGWLFSLKLANFCWVLWTVIRPNPLLYYTYRMFCAIGYLEFFFRLSTANLILRKSSLFCHQKVLTWTSRNFSRHNMPSTTNIGLSLRFFSPSFFSSFTNELSDCASPGVLWVIDPTSVFAAVWHSKPVSIAFGLAHSFLVLQKDALELSSVDIWWSWKRLRDAPQQPSSGSLSYQGSGSTNKRNFVVSRWRVGISPKESVAIFFQLLLWKNGILHVSLFTAW